MVKCINTIDYIVMERTFHTIDQNTEEWYNLRAGRFTASSIKNLLMSKTTKGYQDEIKRVAVERATGIPVESFTSFWMDRGRELESYARDVYQAETFNVVKEGGFWTLGDDMGASPDGLIGEDGLIEIKSVKWNTIVDYLLKGTVPSEYYKQIQHQLMVTGRKWCDFVAFYPGLKLVIERVMSDEDMHTQILAEVKEAVERVNLIIPKIKI